MDVVGSRADALLGEVFFALAKGSNTPVSLSCWLMYKYGEHSQLAKKDINPLDYNCGDTFRRDYAVVKYLSKYKGLRTGIDVAAVARDSWKSSEEKCRQTNLRFREASLRGFSPRVEAVLYTAKRKIAALLGPCRSAVVLSSCRWGPGATFSLKGESSTVCDKIREYPISVTLRAFPYLRAVMESDPHWAEALFQHSVDGPFSLLPGAFKIVPGCRATLVDKNAKTQRSIAIEPTGNVFLQLGVGRYIRSRLKRRGVDLDDQTLNQRLAAQGSKDGSLATVDLSSASDTVSTELVYQLLPLEWAFFLDSLRSPLVLWKGEDWIKLEKFSSMGNGFTFELESLIFWALSSAVVDVMGLKVTVGVYGDDIIVPSCAYHYLTEVLAACGFSVNTEKTFATGYFRESCGKHYWKGNDVTPVYQKEPVTSLPEAYRCSNRIIRLAYKRDELYFAYLADEYRTAWLSSLRIIPLFLRRWEGDVGKSLSSGLRAYAIKMAGAGGHCVPFGDTSDDGLMLPFGELEPFILARRFHGGTLEFKLPVMSFRPSSKLFDGRSQLAYLLRFGSDEPFNGRIAVRRRGKWVTRRRWFSVCSFTPRSTRDVAWLTD